MSHSLFNFKPEELMVRARREREQQAMVLRMVADALLKPGVTAKDLTELIECEMPAVRTGMALARNYQQEAERQRAALQPVMDLWARRAGEEVAA
jgi:hypothetical protein